MLNCVDTTGNMYLARQIMPHPEVSLLFCNIRTEGKPWDCAVNLILHLSGEKASRAWGAGSPPMCLYLKLMDDEMKVGRATLMLPVISVLRYNLMRTTPENKIIPDKSNMKMDFAAVHMPYVIILL